MGTDFEAIEEEGKTLRILIGLIRGLCVSLLILPTWFLYNQEIRVGRSDGFGVVKFVTWHESPTEFLCLMLLTLVCVGICWGVGAYLIKHLRLQLKQLESG
jgi:hypothetical protein